MPKTPNPLMPSGVDSPSGGHMKIQRGVIPAAVDGSIQCTLLTNLAQRHLWLRDRRPNGGRVVDGPVPPADESGHSTGGHVVTQRRRAVKTEYQQHASRPQQRRRP